MTADALVAVCAGPRSSRDLSTAFVGMHPTLLPGDLVLATKFDYGIRLPGKTDAVSASLPQLGDVVVFSKRGTAGALHQAGGGPARDRIELRDGALWRNGQPFQRSRVRRRGIGDWKSSRHRNCTAQVSVRSKRRWGIGPTSRSHDDPALTQQRAVPPVEVGPSQVYLLGDNRDNSHDSRHFGPIAASRVTGRIRYIAVVVFPPRVSQHAHSCVAVLSACEHLSSRKWAFTPKGIPMKLSYDCQKPDLVCLSLAPHAGAGRSGREWKIDRRTAACSFRSVTR